MTTRANHLGVLALAAAAMLAACILVLIGTVKPAGAAFPGQNGEIVFERSDADFFAFNIFSIRPDGTDLSQLTETPRSTNSHPS